MSYPTQPNLTQPNSHDFIPRSCGHSYTTALTGRDHTLGPESEKSIETAACLAAFLFEEDRIEDAEALWARVFKARKLRLGPLALDTAVAAFNLGIILQVSLAICLDLEEA